MQINACQSKITELFALNAILSCLKTVFSIFVFIRHKYSTAVFHLGQTGHVLIDKQNISYIFIRICLPLVFATNDEVSKLKFSVASVISVSKVTGDPKFIKVAAVKATKNPAFIEFSGSRKITAGLVGIGTSFLSGITGISNFGISQEMGQTPSRPGLPSRPVGPIGPGRHLILDDFDLEEIVG
jgi:hypothetical protein